MGKSSTEQRMNRAPRLARAFGTAAEKHYLQLSNLNQNLVKAEYAVRGAIVTRAAQIEQEIQEGKQYPFDSLTECNIGNPQYFGQKPISFSRQVLSIMMNPESLATSGYSKDVKNRAKSYIDRITGGIGAYSESVGLSFVRENIARFIQQRDGGITASKDLIIQSDGASKGIQAVLSALITRPEDGIMIPIPQYPLYTALITYMNGREVPYYLDEAKGWSVSAAELEASVKKARENGTNVRGMVIINPGNPTGQVLDEASIQTIVKFAYENKIVLLADEVYQENIYKAGKKFHSFKKVVSSLPAPYNKTELFSFHSTSKGFIGECGFRGGYLEMHNICPEVRAQMTKLQSIFLCPNLTGQLTTELMVNPPNPETESAEAVQQYQAEKGALLSSLKKRAEIVTTELNSMLNIRCNEVEGAMYAFPSLFLSDRVVQEAKAKGVQPDMFYCLKALEKTGIVIVPGSGFRQRPGTFHFRITTLILPEEKMFRKLQEFKAFNAWFHKEYSSPEVVQPPAGASAF
eukprot:TRINITY_DN1084_c0_g1_i1.p1 TRINITY_DN1084_c0_g1~~TRINITY_DN1084_c0_g1_i1.p1  ORF type:complete len:519 (-),score=144.01 TRINITY_DN1084_c0_g1_i1:45-1601(-)